MKYSYLYKSELNHTFDKKIIKVCIVGAGRAGRFHINSLSINKQYKLLYIIDKDKDRAYQLSKIADCNYSVDLDWVLENVVFDAVIICSTTPTHYELTQKCLYYNKHILCEKPLGENEKEISNLFYLANSRKLKLLVAYQKRFDKNYNRLYELLNGKKPKNIYLKTRDHPLPPLDYLKASNGIVEDMISHDIDIANLYMGFECPEKISAFSYTHNEVLKEHNEIEGIEILMQYKNGEIVHLSGSRDAKHGYDQRVEVFGSFGMYRLENQLDNTISHFSEDGSNYSHMNYSFTERYKEAYINELNYFYKMITENYAPLVEEYHLLLTKKVCDAINESLRKNTTIILSDPLRTYKIDTPQYHLYCDMYKNQTLKFIKNKRKEYSQLKKQKMSIKKALLLLDDFIDPSDPDLDIDNSIHAYQTAERIRKKYPENKEFQIIGLIHDLGKVLYSFGEPSWAVVGDTYVLGCEFPKSIVYYDTLTESPEYNKYDKNGIYTEGCGLNNLIISYGHDEYLYTVLKGNKNHKISPRYMDVIRYHSFYPWHTKGEYKQFMNEKDKIILKDVLQFNEFDLYSKEDETKITDETKKYYDTILDDFFQGDMEW